MKQGRKRKHNNISVRSRIYCFLEALSDPKFSLNINYANSSSKIRLK